MTKRNMLILFFLAIIAIAKAQDLKERYDLINDYLKFKLPNQTEIYLYNKPGDGGLFDKKDSFLLKRDNLASKFRLLNNSASRVHLIDSIFSHLEVKYLLAQSKHYNQYKWNKSMLDTTIILIEKPEQLKKGYDLVGLSVPLFINDKKDWAFLVDFQKPYTWILLLNRQGKKWRVVEEYPGDE